MMMTKLRLSNGKTRSGDEGELRGVSGLSLGRTAARGLNEMVEGELVVENENDGEDLLRRHSNEWVGSWRGREVVKRGHLVYTRRVMLSIHASCMTLSKVTTYFSYPTMTLYQRDYFPKYHSSHLTLHVNAPSLIVQRKKALDCAVTPPRRPECPEHHNFNIRYAPGLLRNQTHKIDMHSPPPPQHPYVPL